MINQIEQRLKIYFISKWSDPYIMYTNDVKQSISMQSQKMIKSSKNRDLYKISLQSSQVYYFYFSEQTHEKVEFPDSSFSECKFIFLNQEKQNKIGLFFFITTPGKYICYDKQIYQLPFSKQQTVEMSSQKNESKSSMQQKVVENNFKKIIIFTDIDFTLIDHKANFSYQSFKHFWIMNFLLNKNFILVYNSGRNILSILRVQKKCNMLTPDYYVTSNGTKMYNCNEFQDLATKNGFVEIEEWRQKVEKGWNYDKILQNIQYHIQWFQTKQEQDLGKLYRIISTCKYTDFLSSSQKFLQISDDLKKSQQLEFDNIVSGFPDDDENKYLDIVPKGINKGTAAFFLTTQIVKTGIENSVSFGDSLNDIEMLEMCGTGIAVKNLQSEMQQWLKNHPQSKVNVSNMEYADALIQYMQKFL